MSGFLCQLCGKPEIWENAKTRDFINYCPSCDSFLLDKMKALKRNMRSKDVNDHFDKDKEEKAKRKKK